MVSYNEEQGTNKYANKPPGFKCVNFDICENYVFDLDTCWRGTTGWYRLREGGGPNHIALRKDTGQVMCDHCMEKERKGIAPGQESIL